MCVYYYATTTGCGCQFKHTYLLASTNKHKFKFVYRCDKCGFRQQIYHARNKGGGQVSKQVKPKFI